jgi:hypothetical protein
MILLKPMLRGRCHEAWALSPMARGGSRSFRLALESRDPSFLPIPNPIVEQTQDSGETQRMFPNRAT